MKLIIAGGRDYGWTDRDARELSKELVALHITEVVSGGARGADAMGERAAEIAGVPVVKFHPQWKKHGKAAGPLRNREMANYADALMIFPGGRGTDSMLHEAEMAGITIWDKRPGKRWGPYR